MTSVVFETASLADALKKASRVAPTRGRQLTQYAGFFIEIRPDGEGSGEVLLRCTDGGIFYMEWIQPLEIEGESADWRVPSTVTSSIVNALPVGSGKKVKFKQDGGKIRITSSTTRASIGLIETDNYPEWATFEEDIVRPVPQFGERLDQVAWARSNKDALVTSGIYMDKTSIVGTDGTRLAVAPLEMPMEEESVVVPMAALAPILTQMTEAKAGIEGNFLCIQPNEYTQIKCVLLGEDYPNVTRLMSQQTEETIMFNRELATEIVQRIMTIIAKERQNNLDVTIGNGVVSFYTEDEAEVNNITDTLDLDGQCQHGPIRYRFGPDHFSNAVNKAPGLLITMNYNPSKPLQAVRFEGQDGYKCWVQPRRAVVNG